MEGRNWGEIKSRKVGYVNYKIQENYENSPLFFFYLLIANLGILKHCYLSKMIVFK